MISKLLAGKTFTRSIVTLMSGTMMAQVIPVAVSPILTRIYSPEDFGVLALYIAILSVVTVVASMRYELAIVQSEKGEDARVLVQLSIIICTLLSLSFLIFVVLYDYSDSQFLGLGSDSYILYLLPFGFFLNGIVQIGRYWLLRKEKYRQISGVVVSQSAGAASGQVLAGYVGVGTGLLYGHILGQLCSFVFAFIKSFVPIKELFRGTSSKKIIELAKRYRNLPQYSIAGALADSLSVQLPVLIISRVFGAGIVGLFSFTFKVLNLPLVALSGALSQVLFRKISVLSVEKPDKIKPMLIKTNLLLVGFCIPFVTFFWLWGEPVFAFVFGESWRDAGGMASILSLAVAIRFSVSPLSSVLIMDKNVRLGVAWQFLYLATITLTFAVFHEEGIEALLFAFVVHECCIYSFYYYLILKGADRLKGNQ